MQRALRLVLPRVKRLPDLVEQVRPFLTNSVEYDAEAVRKHLTTADLDDHVETLILAIEADGGAFDEASIERVLRNVADARRIKAASLIHAARIAATGKAVSPGIFEVLALLGKPLTVARLRDLVAFLRNPQADIASPRLTTE
jgi:glutamyl-tRNA synthetase